MSRGGLSNEDVVRVYLGPGNRSAAATATILSVSITTVRRRLLEHYGSAGKVPHPPLRSSGPAIGRAFENRVRDELRERDYFVIRAAGSKGKVDLLALAPRTAQPIRSVRGVIVLPDGPFLIQVRRSGAVGPAEWNALWELARKYAGLPLIASTPGRGIVWHRLTGPKDRLMRQQPWEPYELS